MRPRKFLQKFPFPFLHDFLASFLAIIVVASVLGSEAIDLEWDENQEPNLAGCKARYGTPLAHHLSELKSEYAPLVSNDHDEGPFVIQLTGLASAPVAPEISLQLENGTELSSGLFISNLGVTNIGFSSSLKVYIIKNSGSANLKGLKLSVDNSAFVFSNLTITSLAPGAATTFNVSFRPTSVGLKSATLRISSDNADEAPFNVGLAATGADAPTPEIAVFQTDGSEVASGQSNSQFDSTQVGTAATARSFNIKNLGTAKLANLALSSTNNQFTCSNLTTTTLAPGASTSFRVTFKPGSAGAHPATVRISSNDADENPFDLHFSGTGTKLNTPPETAVAASPPPSTSVSGIAVVDNKKYLMLTATWLAGDRTYSEIVEVSPNLVDWYSGSNHTTPMISSPSILQVRDKAALGSTPSRFIRLRPAPRTADR